MNLGDEFRLERAKEPLLAPEKGSGWSVAWSASPRGRRQRRSGLGCARERSMADSNALHLALPYDEPVEDEHTLTAPHVQLIGWKRGEPDHALLTREWLVTNSIGGYATGTVAGVAMRRYHGLLVAALPVPLGRTVMLNHLEECLVAPTAVGEATLALSGDEPAAGTIRLPDLGLLDEFRLEQGLPVWRFENEELHLTKRLLMSHLQNTTLISYHLDAASKPVRRQFRPSVHFRSHELDVATPLGNTATHSRSTGRS